MNTQAAIEILEERVMLTAFVVDSNLDTVDAADGQTTLREAITAANANAGLDTISFNVSGGGPQTIVLASALPTVTDQIIIDGSTQPGITIDATGVVGTVLLLGGNADGSTLQNFAISNAQGTALRFVGVANALIDGLDLSYVGTGATGVGLRMDFGSHDNTVRNVTATNRVNAIQLGRSDGNLIEQNNFSQAGSISIFVFGTANANVFRQNDSSGSTNGIWNQATGLGNQYVDNNLSDTGNWSLTIRNDTQFVVAGNDFTGSRHGVALSNMDGITIDSTNLDIDVSMVTGTGLTLGAVTNSTIDGLDLSYAGSGTSGTGLNINSSDNNTVRNVTATNRSIGIGLNSASDNLIEQNNVSQAGSGGIGISQESSRNVFRLNNASGSFSGITVWVSGRGNQFVDNDLSGTVSWGLDITGDSEFVATGNDFTGSGNGMSLRFMDGITLTPSTTFDIDVSTVTGNGLSLAVITNSIIKDLDLSFVGNTATGMGLRLFGSDNNMVTNVTATNRSIGIQLNSADGNRFEQNNVSQAGSNAIFIKGASSTNVFRQNDASGSFTGISANVSGRGNQYVDNDLSGTVSWGLNILRDSQFVATGNDFTGSGGGVFLQSMDGITLSPSDTFDIDVSTVTGIGLSLVDVTNSTIDGLDLSYSGNSTSGTGLKLSKTDTTTVRNVIANNRSIGIQLKTAVNTLIHCTQITHNGIGIFAVGNTSGVTVSDSQIEGNDIGIKNQGTNTVLAENNYWGAADGPSNLGGSGDSYFGNVDAAPFLTSLPDCLVHNVAPGVMADAATVTVNEGQTATMTGTVSDADGDVVTLTASSGTVVNNNNGTWSWSLGTNDGPGDGTAITIFADDGNGGTADVGFTLIVNNVAPTAVADSYGAAVFTQFVANDAAGTADAVAANNGVLANDTDPAGAADPLEVIAANGSALNGMQGTLGDGSVTFTTGLGATVTMKDDGTFAYDATTSGTLLSLAEGVKLNDTFTYTISDGDGGTATGTVTVTVTGGSNNSVHVIVNADGTNALVVRGSSVDDEIEVKPGLLAGTFKIEIENAALGGSIGSVVNATDGSIGANGSFHMGTFKFDTTAGGISKVIVYGLDGNDSIKVHSTVGVMGWLFGGNGDDRLRGGKGDDLLVGGAGNDRLDGKAGRDILIGGDGADKIRGRQGEDLLIGGWTSYDNNLAALSGIMAEWTSANSFADRVANISNGGGSGSRANGSFFFDKSTVVVDDGDVDELDGGNGADWFIASVADGDKVKGFENGADIFGLETDWFDLDL